MTTPRAFATTCSARAALAGNPSDGYGGAVVAVPVDELFAVAATSEADTFEVTARDPDLRALLRATADGYAGQRGALPAVVLTASTTIPRSVGLAGSSALVIAALRSLAAAMGHRWSPVELAELALAVERDHLGITAGPQDGLVQSVGEPVAMRFDPLGYEVLTLPDDLCLFVAWQSAASEPSDTVHRSLRRRFDAGDDDMRRVMHELAAQAEIARRAIHEGSIDALGGAMDRSFELRCEISDVAAPQRELVAIGRRKGARVNSAGSGGSVVGLASDARHLTEIEQAYRAAGIEWLALTA